jgi:hypothetical protein
VRQEPILPYCGLTIILSNPSRFDTESLISGHAGVLFDHYLQPLNRHACDIKTIDEPEIFLPNTKVVLVMGARACEYLNIDKIQTLSQARGSVYERNGMAVIPTFHPQDCADRKNYEATLNKHLIQDDINEEADNDEDDGDDSAVKDKGPTSRRNYLFWFGKDLWKARQILKTGIQKNKCNYIIYPPASTFYEWCLNQRGQKIFLDIETNPETQQLLCFSVSNSAKEVLTIPVLQFNGNLAYNPESLGRIFRGLVWLFKHNNLVLHNGSYDLFMLMWRFKIPPPMHEQIEDTMIRHRRLFPDVEKSLGHCISFLTHELYHKDEGMFFPKNHDQDKKLWLYNAKDVERTAQVYYAQEYWIELFKARGSVNHGCNAIRTMLLKQLRGVKVDLKSLCKQIDINEKMLDFWNNRVLSKLVGYRINARSPQAVGKYLYEHLGLKQPMTGSATGKKTLYTLQMKHDIPALSVILHVRRISTEQGKLRSVLWNDGRWTGTFDLAGPKSFRLASKKLLGHYGTNMQNFNKRTKKHVIADKGYELVQVDLSGVEAHIVAYLCPPGSKYRELFIHKIKPHSYVALYLFDTHWNDVMGRDMTYLKECPIGELRQQKDWNELATVIKNTDEAIPSKRFYYFAKQTCHSANYDIKANTFCLNVLDKSEGEVRLPLKEGSRFLNVYHDLFPEIRLGFHEYVKYEVENFGRLVNLFGFPRYATGEISDQEMRDWYSWIPQSTGSGCAAVLADTIIQGKMDRGEIEPVFCLLQNNHDSILAQSLIGRSVELAKIISEHFAIELTSPYGEKFTLRSEAQVGETWAKMKEIRV